MLFLLTLTFCGTLRTAVVLVPVVRDVVGAESEDEDGAVFWGLRTALFGVLGIEVFGIGVFGIGVIGF